MTSSIHHLTLTAPDDFHIHLRDGDMLLQTVADVSRYFHRALVMPNLKPPITTTEQALAYYQRIKEQVPSGRNFEPLMTLYLTQTTSVAEIKQAKDSGRIVGAKLYPQGATTNSQTGVHSITALYPVFAAMEAEQMVLQIHGEVVDPDVDIFEREVQFIEQELKPLVHAFPKLKIVLEHITTQAAVNFILQTPATIAATITAHHLYLNRTDLLAGGIKPHYYCLPIVKKESDRQALIQAAVSGNPKFFLGTDSAPHFIAQKESACGCAGIYTAHAALEFYATIFEAEQQLERLEAFASFYGADFYGLARNHTKISLIKSAWTIPAQYPFGTGAVVPFRAEQSCAWSVAPQSIL